jgi:hypothetical protein
MGWCFVFTLPKKQKELYFLMLSFFNLPLKIVTIFFFLFFVGEFHHLAQIDIATLITSYPTNLSTLLTTCPINLPSLLTLSLY